MGISFIVSDEDRARIGSGELDLIGTAVQEVFELPQVQVELSLASPEDIQELNLSYRELDEPTDVLSFQLFGSLREIQELPTEATVLLGSIIICPEKVAAYNETLPQMVQHGLLHVLGFDHVTDHATWQAAERPVLARLAVDDLNIPEVTAE